MGVSCNTLYHIWHRFKHIPTTFFPEFTALTVNHRISALLPPSGFKDQGRRACQLLSDVRLDKHRENLVGEEHPAAGKFESFIAEFNQSVIYEAGKFQPASFGEVGPEPLPVPAQA